jgi:hypothetical protein
LEAVQLVFEFGIGGELALVANVELGHGGGLLAELLFADLAAVFLLCGGVVFEGLG